MLYIRVVPSYSSVFTSWPWINGTTYVNVAADDAPEQMRMIFNTIAHFPIREMYDPFTHFPYGSPVHFGPFFTLMIAFASIVAGLGHPSAQLVATVAAYAPAVLGALCAVPTYLIGKKLFGRNIGLLAAFFLAFMPGEFLGRSMLGFVDHHVAEVLFSVLTVAMLAYALDAAKKANLSLEQIKNKDWNAVKRPLLFAGLAGLAYALYILVWPGALMVGFMLFVYFVIQAVINHLEGKPLDQLVIVATLLYIVPAILVLPYSLGNLHLELMYYSITQPLFLCIAVAGVWALYGVSRVVSGNKAEKWMYPVTLAGLAIVGLLAIYMLVPALFGLIVAGFKVFAPNGGMLTVAEAQPTYIDSSGNFSLDRFWYDFVWGFPLAALGIVFLLFRVVRDRKPAELMFLVWNALMLAAMFTQIRFTYYFAVNASILSAYFALVVFDMVVGKKFGQALANKVRSLGDLAAFAKKNTGKTAAMALVAAVFILMASAPVTPLGIWPTAPLGNPITTIEAQSGSGMSYEWYETLYWMNSHTPDPQGSQVSSSFDYLNGTYTQPAQGERYDYPSSAYGVMSWWDYGHMIEYVAQRAPNANPFQAGIIEENGTAGSSLFFTSQNESASYQNLNTLGSRYVVIDNQMATGKFGAIQKWIDDTDGWYSSAQINLGTGNAFNAIIDSDKLYNSTMYKLYYGDADGMSHYRLVHDSAGDYTVTFKYADLTTDTITYYASKTVSNYTDASQLYEQTQQPVWISNGQSFVWDSRPPEKWVKVFEKVLGATLTGSAPDGVQVNASVTLQSGDRQFTYTNSAVAHNGSYSITVPYPTEAMKGANYSYDVAPVSKYTVGYGNTTKTVDVPETAVMNGDTIQV
jgi:dolichyl-diphosphooligosaccharide--protein glycosyltransferase